MSRNASSGAAHGDTIFGRAASAMSRRRLARVADRMSDHMLRDLGYQRDHWGDIAKLPSDYE